MTNRTVEFLLEEHGKIAAVFAELKSLRDSNSGTAAWTADHTLKFQHILEQCQNLIVPHMELENGVLFPALEDFLPRDTGPLAVLRGEHSALSEHVARLHDAGVALSQGNLERGVRQQFSRHCTAAMETLRDHFYKEEQLLFPMIARLLSPERDRLLLIELQKKQRASGIAPPAP